MKIIVDAFGGDKAPLEALKGCRLAIDAYGVEIILTGDKEEIIKVAKENQISLDKMEILHAPDVISMHDEPGEIMKSLSNCSMAVGMKLLSEKKGEAFLSAGNTGALLFGATFIIKRIKGVKRPALAPLLPTDTGLYMLIDGGANLDCRPEMLSQFGLMGSIYMEKVEGINKPRVALVNIGEEKTKGTQLQLDAYELMQKTSYNFIGNIEPRYISDGNCDVAVADGFTGNVILKLSEGLAMTFYKNIKGIFLRSIISKFAALLLMPGLKAFKKKLDYTEYGGAPLLGLTMPVIKAHGSSNANAFKNAIRQAKKCVESQMVDTISQQISMQRIKDE
jgi:phosphate acyltransferase